MATIMLGHLFDMVEDQVVDEDNALWDIKDILNWYNIGTRTITSINPRANPAIESVKLASGVKQRTPPGSIALIDVLRNMGTDGVTAGRTVTLTTIDALRASAASFSTVTAATTVYNFARDPDDIALFWIYPPSPGTNYVELEFSKVPTVTVYDDDGDYRNAYIAITDQFVDALINYILHRVYGKDTDVPGNDPRSVKYYSLFRQSPGIAEILGAQAQGGR